jgi:hypothetical protein
MTVAVAPEGYLRSAPGGGLDLAATRAVLDAATASLKALVAAHTAE